MSLISLFSSCYCMECLDILVGVGTFKKLKEMDPWICYLCAPENSSGAMRPRHDWSIRVQEFFANTSGVDFVSVLFHTDFLPLLVLFCDARLCFYSPQEFQRVYPAIPANQRRPIRVLSLFDGIATGNVAHMSVSMWSHRLCFNALLCFRMFGVKRTWL